MSDTALIVYRWVLFADLGVLFGFALLLAQAVSQPQPVHDNLGLRAGLIAMAAIGIGATLAGFVWQAAAMAGVPPSGLDMPLLWALLAETALGWAAIARLSALTFVVGFVATRRDLPPGGGLPVTAGSALALATLTWSGHGAADVGARGWAHLGADITHLLAAGAWLGALAGFLVLVSRGSDFGSGWSDTAHRALAGFANTGTLLVALLVVTGVLNFYFIAGFDSLAQVAASDYGQLLALKLLLFLAMLVFAAVNRFSLTPALGQATDIAELGRAQRRLRTSLAIEFALGLLLVALVARFGTLSPGGMT